MPLLVLVVVPVPGGTDAEEDRDHDPQRDQACVALALSAVPAVLARAPTAEVIVVVVAESAKEAFMPRVVGVDGSCGAAAGLGRLVLATCLISGIGVAVGGPVVVAAGLVCAGTPVPVLPGVIVLPVADRRGIVVLAIAGTCLLYTSPSPRDPKTSRMPSSA